MAETKRPFATLDVFTKETLAGNPLAIVQEADELTEDQMQAIAREFNLSETVFVCKARRPGHSAKIRIFTPDAEVDFAGHPTLGTAILLATDRAGEVEREEDAIVVLEENIGAVRVGVRMRPDEPPFAEFDSPVLPKAEEKTPDLETLSLVLGITKSEIGFENFVPTAYSAGLNFVFVPVRNLSVMSEIVVNMAAWKEIGPEEMPSIYVYTGETVQADAAFHARMFAPFLGVSEDPATGSAAVAFAGVLNQFDQPLTGTHKYIIEQGLEMNRPSQIILELVLRDGLHAVRIGGYAKPLLQGEITL